MQFVDRSIIPCHYLQIIQSVIKENALNMQSSIVYLVF